MPRMNSIMERWVQTCRHHRRIRTVGAGLLPRPVTGRFLPHKPGSWGPAFAATARDDLGRLARAPAGPSPRTGRGHTPEVPDEVLI